MRMFKLLSGLSISFLLLVGLRASATTITFEGLADSTNVGSTYAAMGVTFTNAMVLTTGISLNELEFPPHSGVNVASDNGGPITISFATPVDSFSAYFTYAVPLQLVGFNGSHVAVATADSMYSANYVSTGEPTNELIALSFPGGISSVTITGDPTGGSFAVDDVTYGAGTPVTGTTPEPGSLFLLGTGALAALARRRFGRA